MPAPTDIEAIKGINPETEEEEERPSSDDAPFAALAFKIMTDPFVGKLGFFRVYSGTLSSGSTVYNPDKDVDENSRSRRSTMISRCSSPMPAMMVWPVSSSV